MPSKAKLEDAIRHTKRWDPNLELAIVVQQNSKKNSDQSGGMPAFRLKRTPHDVCGQVIVLNNQCWKEVAHKALNEIHFPKPTADKPTPTWKVLLVEDSNNTGSAKSAGALFFVLHHMMFDGTSRHRLIHAVLTCLHSTKAPIHAVPITSADEISKHTKRMSWFQFLRQCAYNFGFELRTLKIPSWYMDLSRPPGIISETDSFQKETHQILHQLPTQETNAIIKRCKQEGTTVHGALSAAAMLALLPFEKSSAEKQDIHDKKRTIMGCSHLISLGDNLADYIPSGSLSGCRFSLYRTVIDRSDDKCWQIARAVKSELVQSNVKFAPPQMKQFVFNMKYNLFLQKLFRRQPPPEYGTLQRIPTVAISNNGSVNYDLSSFVDSSSDEVDGFKVEGSYASSARHNAPGNLAVFNFQTIAPRNKLCISLSYYTHIWTDETAHEYMERFCKTLLTMCSA
jgi:hypothetical protein